MLRVHASFVAKLLKQYKKVQGRLHTVSTCQLFLLHAALLRGEKLGNSVQSQTKTDALFCKLSIVTLVKKAINIKGQRTTRRLAFCSRQKAAKTIKNMTSVDFFEVDRSQWRQFEMMTLLSGISFSVVLEPVH